MSLQKIWKWIFVVIGLGSLSPLVSSAQALLAGLFLTLIFENPWLEQTKKIAPKLLAYSVVGLGAGMNLNVVFKVGAAGVGYTVVGITCTLIMGWILGKMLGNPRDTTVLVSVGTAICGGSAIAAVAPVIRAKSQDVSISLVVVFVLNAIALIVFPWLGHHFELSQHQFGLFSALAIHDTSSVVGSAAQFGEKALEVATTVKLTRALWIIPVALFFAVLEKMKSHSDGAQSFKKPWFILGFIVVAALVTFFPSLQVVGAKVNIIAKRSLVLTLFLIGSNCPKKSLKEVGMKPLALGVLLWLIVSLTTLGALRLGWIK